MHRELIALALALVTTVASATVTVRPDRGTVGANLTEAGVTSGGAWNIPSDVSARLVAVGGGKGVRLQSGGKEAVSLAFDAALADRPAQFDVRIAFPDVTGIAEDPCDVDEHARFAITLAEKADGNAAFAGYSRSGWMALSGEGIVAEPGRWYDIRIETREIGGAAFVSYLVKLGADYVRLENAVGAAWFRIAGEGRNVSRLEFLGNGTFADITGDRGSAEPQKVTVRWTGGAGGDWADAAKWTRTAGGGGAPAVGDVVLIDGVVEMTSGDEAATIRDGVFAVGVDGRLTALAGSLATPFAFDRTQVKIGQKLDVSSSAFAGLTPPVVSCRWQRGDLNRRYAADAVSSSTSYAPTADDCERWLRVTAQNAGGARFVDEFFVSELPVLYLTTDDGETPSQDKEEHDGHVFVQGNGTNGKSFAGDSAMKIKVRGNSTRTAPKKPWKIKLEKKQMMFGIPKSKHWVLLANYNDESSMRNRLAADFANEIGSLGMKSTWVECVLNGEWQGLYLFSEHVRIASGRVDVFSWEDEAEERGESDENFAWVDPAAEDITGGYLFESSQEYDELTRFTIDSGNLTLKTMLNSPEFLYTNPAMVDWCRDYLQKFCDATTSADGYSDGMHWSEYCDTDSMVTYFLVMEMFGNDDAVKKSRYFYKDRGAPLRFGPVWDFDWGVGNDVVLGVSAPTGWKVQEQSGSRESFYKEWADDPWFCTALRNAYWSRARTPFARLIAEDGELYVYKARLLRAGAANDTRWKRTRGFAADVERLRDYLTQRLAWLDAQFSDVPTLMASLKAATGSVPSTAPYVRDTETLPVAIEGADGNGRFVYRGRSPRVTFAVGGSTVKSVGVYVNGLKVGGPTAVPVALSADRRISVKLPITMFTAGKGEQNCLSVVGFDAGGRPVARNYFLATADRPGALVIGVR